MPTRRRLPATFLLLAVASAPAAGRAAEPPLDFEHNLRSLLAAYCYRCHGEQKQSGGLNLVQFQTKKEADKELALWGDVARRTRLKEMPPRAAKEKPTDEERAKLIAVAARLADGDPGDRCHMLASDRTQRYRGYALSRRLTRGEYANSVRDLLGLELNLAELLPADGAGGEGFDTNGDTLYLSAIQIEKYLDAADRAVSAVLPTGDAAARARLLVARPGPGTSARDAARAVVGRFARQAFRRPVTTEGVDRLLTLFDRAMARGESFEAALRLPLKGVLVSPHFLFLAEPVPPEDGDYPLGPYQLATRLSYFLWSSIPDEELLSLAEQGKLRDDAVLRQQVRRMLADPKSRAMAEQFALQWLNLTALGGATRPDPKRFPECDDELLKAMREEVILNFNAVVREDRSLLELLDGDSTFVNDRLAELYGLPGGAGNAMRRVKLSDRSRGGLIGTAAVLTATSYPLRTSPVLRGKWVLEELLGSKVPPPPPNAGELPKDDAAAGGLTFRQRLEQHRTNPECASCHARMDPLGFGLENFDPIGRWRTEQAGQAVDASGELPSGEKFRGPQELKDMLLKRKPEFLRNLTRKLLGYALGRPLNKFDECVIDDSLKALAANDNRAGVLIEQVVLSYPFRYRYAKH